MLHGNLTINVESLLKNKLSLTQFFILHCLCYKDERALVEYATAIERFSLKDIKSLEDRGFIINANKDSQISFNSIIVTESALEVFGIKAQTAWFDELWETYPRTTNKGRVLKQISKQKAYHKYIKHVKDESSHRNVIAALRRELLHRIATGNMEYMQNLETWLNNEGWSAFPEDTQPKSKQFGNELE